MGNPCTIHYASALAALISLTGCKQQVTQEDAEFIAERHSEIALNTARAEVAQLKTQLGQIELRLAYLESMDKINSKAIEGVSARVSHNATVANNNALKDMTADGVCGRERVDYPNGSWIIRNRKCTLDDMGR